MQCGGYEVMIQMGVTIQAIERTWVRGCRGRQGPRGRCRGRRGGEEEKARDFGSNSDRDSSAQIRPAMITPVEYQDREFLTYVKLLLSV